MNKKIIITCIIVMAAVFTSCFGQPNKHNTMKGVSHGKEKAYDGDKMPGMLQELRLSILENDEETTSIEMKYMHGFYDTRYTTNGKRHMKAADPRQIRMLQDILEHIYQAEDYYQDYKSKKGPQGLELHVGTKHDNAVFLLNAERINPKDFGIVNAILGFFDSEFELVTPQLPFPDGKLTLFTYTNKGSMRPGGPEWTVKATDGGYEVTYFNDSGKVFNEEPIQKKQKFSAEVGEKITEFLKAGNAQSYKSEYMNPGVTDGSRWTFTVQFDSGKSINSGGYMDGPRDSSGITNSLKYLESLMDVK